MSGLTAPQTSTSRKFKNSRKGGKGERSVSGTNGRHSRIANGIGSTESVLAEEREALIHSRQSELDQVIDEHDDMVREAFHLEKFVTLLHYDPKEAKEDQSAVFREYKANYDLLSQTPTAGPSRQTRRRATELLQSLKGPVTPKRPEGKKDRAGNLAPGGSPLSTSISRTTPRKATVDFSYSRKGKGKAQDMAHKVQDDLPSKEMSLSTRSPKSRSKSKARPSTPADNNKRISSSVQRNQSIMDDDALPFFSEQPPSPSIRGQSKRQLRSLKSSIASSPALDDASYGLSGTGYHMDVDRNRRRNYGPAPEDRVRNTRQSFPVVGHLSGTYDFSPGHERPSVGDKTIPKPVLGKRKSEEVLSTWQSRIKRVKLMVRKPPPSVSHPAQRPLPARFGNSLSAFLGSYIVVDDIDYDEDGAQQKVIKTVQLLEKIETFKRNGRLMLQPDIALTLLNSNDENYRSTSTESISRRPTDVWSSIVEAVTLRKRDNKGPRGVVVASQIANKIRIYWEGMVIKQEKARTTEEKRLRGLAKSTMKMVTNEWKKAVLYLREQQRRLIEAEQKRIGRQHLDAILSQSGQILEAQQYDFSKADASRSRSQSSGHTSIMSSSDDSEADSEDDDDDSESDDREVTPMAFEVDPTDYENEEEMIDEVLLGNPEDIMPVVRQSSGIPIDTIRVAGSQSMTDSGTVSEINELQQNGHGDLEIEYSDMQSEFDAELGSDIFDQSEKYLDDTGAVIEEDDYDISNIFPPEGEDKHTRDDSMDLVTSEALSESILATVNHSRTGNYEPTYGEVTDSSDRYPVIHDDAIIREDPAMLSSNSGQIDRPISSSPSPYTVEIPSSNDPGINDVAKALDVFNHPTETHDDAMVTQDLIAESTYDQSILMSSPTLESVKTPENHQLAPDDHQRVDSEPLEDVQQDNLSTLEDSTDTQKTKETIDEHVSHASWEVPAHLEPYAVAQVDWDPQDKIKPPILLRGNLRPYQQSGLEWLASLHTSHLNGILADEMGLGKTIQTISLLAHLACDQGIWGPHLIVVPTSVLLNWEMEFKKFLPGFKILSYHGTTKRRKELRQGWNSRHAFNVCVTSYSLASRDAHIFKRKAWYYMILDEAHMIKNFKSQRWNILLAFRSYRRLLLTGTPLQNNLTELWALLQFLMSGTDFANLREFGEWFSNPLEKAIEQGTVMDEETQNRITKLHTVLRPYLLRRLKRDVEKELPSKYEHLVLCRLSKRQRFLYDEFVSRAQTQDDLKSGVYQKVANILMQLRKVCNHPDLFEVRPIVTSFAMDRSAIADFEIKELLIRRRLLSNYDESDHVNLDLFGLNFTSDMNRSLVVAHEIKALSSYTYPSLSVEDLCNPPMVDTLTITGYKKYRSYQQRLAYRSHCEHVAYLNNIRCSRIPPIYGMELIRTVKRLYEPVLQLENSRHDYGFKIASSLVKTYARRGDDFSEIIDRFAFATPAVVARDLPRLAQAEVPEELWNTISYPDFDAVLHRAAVKLQIAFPDLSLLQYDCGKLQELERLLRIRKSGGHRVLIFTQMTKVLDILEIFLSFHGYLYLRLDGATKIEDRQYITERFNADERVFAFIASSRSGGVGINLTGADTVIFYDSDFNPQMDRQCEDRAHRIGQIRDVHIYRFVSAYTVEEAMLRKANQKRSLDDIVIQKGEFDWRNIFVSDQDQSLTALEKAMGDFEDVEDAHAAQVAANEQAALEGEDQNDFAEAEGGPDSEKLDTGAQTPQAIESVEVEPGDVEMDPEEEGEQAIGSISEYMLSVVRADLEFFREWKL